MINEVPTKIINKMEQNNCINSMEINKHRYHVSVSDSESTTSEMNISTWPKTSTPALDPNIRFSFGTHTNNAQQKSFTKRHVMSIVLCVCNIFYCLVCFFGMLVPIVLGILVQNNTTDVPCNVTMVMNDSPCFMSECYKNSCEFQDTSCKLVNFQIDWNPDCQKETQLLFPNRTVDVMISEFISDLKCSHSEFEDRCFIPYPIFNGVYEKDYYTWQLILYPIGGIFVLIILLCISSTITFFIYKQEKIEKLIV